MPRPNGYQSLHTSVISDQGFPFEVQIRTEDMDRRAEEGIAAHWKYKEGRVGAGRDEQYFQWLRQLLEWQQEVRDPQEFLTNLKIDLYPEEVYTFTPRGQVKVLPKGSTPVDFAYSDSHRRRPSMRRRTRQRPHGSPPRPAQERRHRRDLTNRGAQAEPRLAQFRRDVARAQQDQAPDSGRGKGAGDRTGPQGPRERRATLRPEHQQAARQRPPGQGGQRAGLSEPTSCSRRSATASWHRRPCSTSWCRRASSRKSRRSIRSFRPSSAC